MTDSPNMTLTALLFWCVCVCVCVYTILLNCGVYVPFPVCVCVCVCVCEYHSLELRGLCILPFNCSILKIEYLLVGKLVTLVGKLVACGILKI